jgi:hypothetical protein
MAAETGRLLHTAARMASMAGKFSLGRRQVRGETYANVVVVVAAEVPWPLDRIITATVVLLPTSYYEELDGVSLRVVGSTERYMMLRVKVVVEDFDGRRFIGFFSFGLPEFTNITKP